MRTIVAREFGLFAKRVKDPFLWFQFVDFALIYGIHIQSYCHLVVSTMAIFSFGAMFRKAMLPVLNGVALDLNRS